MTFWDEFPGPNAAYVLQLYDRYRQNPESVDAATRAYFENRAIPAELIPEAAPELAAEKIVGAVNLANSIRCAATPVGIHLCLPKNLIRLC
jgi:2-oxoglutarate dehydrogenase E1 component